MSIIQEFTSPDGILRFIVDDDKEGDVILGFDGFEWHTHAYLLSEANGLSHKVAVDLFIKDLLENRTIIAVSKIENVIRDVWITDDPESERRRLINGEQIDLRYWDGRKCENL